MSGNIRSKSTKNGKTKYQVTIEKGIDSKGVRLREYKNFDTKKEAQRYLTEKVNELNKGLYIEPTKITVAEGLSQWLETAVKPNLEPTTIRGYSVNVDRHIVPYIGNVELQKLTALMIQNLYGELKTKGLSPRSIKYVHTNLRAALQYLYKMRYISLNPADFATPPKQIKAKSDFYTEDEVLELLEAAKGNDIYMQILLAVGLGLRRGEVLALQWADVDFKTSSLTVQRNLVDVNGERIIGDPKTEAGKRTVSVPPYILKALSEHRISQNDIRFKMDGCYENNNLVCCRTDGTYWNTGTFSKRFGNFLKQNNFRHIRYHDLRHTNASLMLKYKVPTKVISENLGHANINITLDTYSHVYADVRKETAEKIEENLFGRLERIG